MIHTERASNAALIFDRTYERQNPCASLIVSVARHSAVTAGNGES